MARSVSRGSAVANILFSAAYNPSSDLSKLWALANTELLTSAYAVFEAETALTKKQPTAVGQLAALVNAITIVPDAPAGFALPAGIIRPAQDQPILTAAIHAQASHLLTGDMKHFGPYFDQSIGGVLVLPPVTYLSLAQAGTLSSPPLPP
jgi:hypothetical protein